ncbi:SGNH/GDSL hydrolase family protein [Candidatus Pelagibacter sp.]|nr:SGNH/GDSL hydrolase family protein [Candidatus Pelagibacter sp.]
MFRFKEYVNTFFTILLSTVFTLAFCEIVLRVKHHFIPHYDIEMGKYAKTLKIKVPNEKINHVHKKNESAILQKVLITTNSYGQRNKEINNDNLNNYERKFLIIGSSITLGWGVEQSNTFSSKLNDLSKKNGKNWIFINGGIGNYNAERYINNYFENWIDINVTDIIINFFVNDTEILTNKKTNFLLKNSHLAVVVWKLINSYKSNLSKENLVNYYEKLYEKDFIGFKIAKENIIKLNNHCKVKKINCYLVNMPDIHQLKPYRLKFINYKMNKFSKSINLKYLDLLDTLQSTNKKNLWNKYNDPHPNQYAHNLIALNIFQNLNK